MTKRQRATLRQILAYSLSSAKGYTTKCYEACDIPDRTEILRLEKSIERVFEPRPYMLAALRAARVVLDANTQAYAQVNAAIKKATGEP